MTISILRLLPDQTIPRPFNRAVDADETFQMMVYTHTFSTYMRSKGPAAARRLAKMEMDTWINRRPDAHAAVKVGNIDTEQPVLHMRDGTKFYAFTE